MRNLLLLIIPSLCLTAFANPPADVQRLKAKLSPDFERVSVSVFPLNDQRKMEGKRGTLDTPSPLPPVWVEFVKQLRFYHNLRVRTPSSSRKVIGNRLRQTTAYSKAMKNVRQGRKAFDQVRLNDADRHLGNALNTLIALRYHWTSSKWPKSCSFGGFSGPRRLLTPTLFPAGS